MIALGCDHGGYELMQEVIKYLEKQQSLSDTLEYIDKRVSIVLAE